VALVLWAALAAAGQPASAPAVAPAGADAPAIRVAPGDWPWWRGPNGDNVAAANQDPPLRWGPTENVVWKSPIPGRGHATPALWGSRIFVPTADDREISVL
jgi:hypothetical protein